MRRPAQRSARPEPRAQQRPAERPQAQQRPAERPGRPPGAALAGRLGRLVERVPPLRRLRRMTLGAGLVLACALFGLGSVVAPLRSWVAQQGELGDLRDDVAARQSRVADLQAQADRWDDPAYVSAQARTRLHYVVPGETSYVVVDPPAGAATGSGDPAPRQPPDRSWLSGLWDSLVGRGSGDAADPAP